MPHTLTRTCTRTHMHTKTTTSSATVTHNANDSSKEAVVVDKVEEGLVADPIGINKIMEVKAIGSKTCQPPIVTVRLIHLLGGEGGVGGVGGVGGL